MHTAITFEDMRNKLNDRFNSINSKLVFGILFAQPTSSFVKDNILSRIQYYSTRSYNSIDFYLPGYGQYWNEEYCNDAQIVARVDNCNWLYSDEKFVNFLNCIEAISRYEYRGECELLLMTYDNGTLKFSEVLIFRLEKLIKNARIDTVPTFFEDIFRILRNTDKTLELDLQLIDIKLKDAFLNSISDQSKSRIMNSQCLEMHNIER